MRGVRMALRSLANFGLLSWLRETTARFSRARMTILSAIETMKATARVEARMRTYAALLRSVCILALLLTAQVARADHTFSHRLVVVGRVVDAEGSPIEGAVVAPEGLPHGVTGACDDQPGSATRAWGETKMRPRSDASGWFVHCFHDHDVRDGTYTVRVENASGDVLAVQTIPVESLFRISFPTISLEGGLPPDLRVGSQEGLLVAGRLARDADAPIVESIRTSAVATGNMSFEVEVEGRSGETIARLTSVTNAYGDFAELVPLEEPARRVVLKAGGHSFGHDLGEAESWVAFTALLPPEPATHLRLALVLEGAFLLLGVVGAIWWAKGRTRTAAGD